MTDKVIPEDLRDFIARYFDSVAQLEALLLLRRSPDEDWDAARTASRLYISEPDAAEVLARLCADGLLTCNDAIYRYGAATSELEAMVGRLAEAYGRHLVPITNLIHSQRRRIRAFANAFNFRKDRS